MTTRAAVILAAALASGWVAPAEAHPGIGIVADRGGNVFYTDLKQVLMIDPAGRVSVAVPDVHTHELYMDARDNLFGEHLWYEGDQTKQWGHRVWKRSPDGNVVDLIGPTRGFRTRFEFVRDAAGNEYWVGDETGDAAKTRTTLFSRSRTGEKRIVARGLVNARWIAAAADGTVYLVDDRHIKRVTPDRRLATISPSLSSGVLAEFIGGVTTDERGNVYVANFGASRVDRLAPDGSLTVFERSGPRYGPTGVLARNGELWVLETGLVNAVRVRRFTQDGTLKGTYAR